METIDPVIQPVRQRRIVLALLTLAAATAVPLRSVTADEPDYKRQLLSHLEGNQPVAGTFEITTTIDPGQQAQLLPPADRTPPGTVVVSEAMSQVLKCRWAWATGREAAESLAGSSNAEYGLLMLPEGTLVGYTPTQFNLSRSEVVGAAFTRPAAFYFLNGGRQTWAEAFKNVELRNSTV